MKTIKIKVRLEFRNWLNNKQRIFVMNLKIGSVVFDKDDNTFGIVVGLNKSSFIINWGNTKTEHSIEAKLDIIADALNPILIPHVDHQDELLSEAGNEVLVTCPANSTNVIFRTVEQPPSTPESLNPDVASLKEARGCDQCNAAMINGVFCHETGCPNARKEREQEELEDMEFESSLNKEAIIVEEDGKFCVRSPKNKKWNGGCYPTRAAAEKRLKEVEVFKHMKSSLQPLSKKEANVMDTKCEECGEPLGPEAFLSKWPVCGKCTRKRHKQVTNPSSKKADQDISLADQVQGFRDRMQAVNDRLANPPAKTADLETTQDLSNVDVKDLSSAILHTIDLLESKIGENVSANPDLHPMLEDLENKVYEIEMKMGIKPTLPEHEALEPEHQEIVKELGEEVDKESTLEVKADDVNTPPPNLPPVGFRYAWDPKNMNWILVQITGAPGGGQ